MGRKGLALGGAEWGGAGGRGWGGALLEVFSQIVGVDTLLLPARPPACLPACLALLACPVADRKREREREKREGDIERKSLSRHGPPAAAVGSSRGMTTVHMVINSSHSG